MLITEINESLHLEILKEITSVQFQRIQAFFSWDVASLKSRIEQFNSQFNTL